MINRTPIALQHGQLNISFSHPRRKNVKNVEDQIWQMKSIQSNAWVCDLWSELLRKLLEVLITDLKPGMVFHFFHMRDQTKHLSTTFHSVPSHYNISIVYYSTNVYSFECNATDYLESIQKHSTNNCHHSERTDVQAQSWFPHYQPPVSVVFNVNTIPHDEF